MNRTGICCFVLNNDLSRLAGSEFKTTTQAAMNKRSHRERYEKLTTIVKTNMLSLINLMNYMSKLPPERRMFRMGSDMLPMFEHPEYSALYDSALMLTVEYSLARAGAIAKQYDIRLSMHPDHYCVLNSENPDVVTRAISVMEYHGAIARMMGFGVTKQDFKINVHLNGRTNIIPYDRLSETVKNCITFENDEKTGDLMRVLDICESYNIPCVFDIHHHWCNSGEYITADNKLIDRVRATWDASGVRPTMHVSQPHETIWTQPEILPNMEVVLLTNNRKDTYKHSDMIANQGLINHLAVGFRDIFDFQIEAKHKSVASTYLHNAVQAQS